MKFKFAKSLCVGAALVMLSTPAMAQQGPYNGGPGGQYNGGPGNTQHMEQQPGMMGGGNEHGGGNGYNHPGNPGMQGQMHGEGPGQMHGEGYGQHGNGYGQGCGHCWREGQHFNGQREVVGDWHNYGLRQPPEGYEWVRDGSQFVLIAVASGIISSIILNSMYH